MYKYLVITEGHFTGSGEYWQQEKRFEGNSNYEVIAEIREYIAREMNLGNCDKYKVYSLKEVVMWEE